MSWIGYVLIHNVQHMVHKWVKGIVVVVGSVLLTTVGIFAADRLNGVGSGIGQIAGVGKAGICLEGSVPFTIDGRVICADMYEVSPSSACPHKTLSSVVQSEENVQTSGCYATSVSGTNPWNYVTLSQAQQMCANAGKRLPSSDEWYHIALGTQVDSCKIHGNQAETTGGTSCMSGIGAYDVIGNVWEWVDEEVVGNTFNNRQLPNEGYVTSVDSQGIALTSGTQADDMYGKDYIWIKQEGVFGMIRGGFYGSDTDAGLYTVNASVLTSFATHGVGFRCVKDAF